MKRVYYSLFYSKLQYGIAAWGGGPACNIEPLLKLQKRAVRYIVHPFYKLPSHPIFKDLKLLKLHDIYRLEICKITNKMTKFDLNGELELVQLGNKHSYNTRLTTNHNYYSIPCNSNLAKTSFNYIAAKLWREVPTELKLLNPLIFKKRYKKHLIELYNNFP